MARTRSSLGSQGSPIDDSVRKSTRTKKKPTLFVPSPSRRQSTSSPGSVKSRDRFAMSSATGESSATDGDSEEEYRPSGPQSMRKRIAGPNPKSKRSKPSANVPKKKQKKNAVKHPLAVALLGKNVALKGLVRDWLRKFNRPQSATQDKGFVDLVNFFCQTCGSQENVMEPTTRWDSVHENLEEIVQDTCNEISENLTVAESNHYFANMHTGENKHVAKNFATFWKLLATLGEEQFVASSSLVQNIIEFLITASQAGLTSFRHSATVAALSFGQAVAERCAKLQESKARSTRQFKAEESKCVANLSKSDKQEYVNCAKRLSDAQSNDDASDAEIEAATKKFERIFMKVRSSFSQKAQRLHEAVTGMNRDLLQLEGISTRIFEKVFAQRYRDVEPVVRSCALQLFSTWMVACGNMFVTDKRVKYYGWMLNDTETKVRVESVKSLNSMLLDEENVSKMEKFISIFHDRIIEMMNDPAAEVVVHVLELLETLLPHSVLCDEDLFLAEELVFINPDETTDPAGWGKVRTAAASFAMCYYDLLSGTAEGESEDVDEDTPDEVRLIGLIRFILDHARLSSNPNAEVEDDMSEDEQDLPPLISQTSDPDLWNNTQSLVLKQVPDLVRTFMHLDDGNFVTNWAAGGRLLQETGFENPAVAKFLGTTTELCDIEARVMVEILFASAKETLASTSNSTSSRRKSVTDRSALESRKAAFSAELVGFISQVLVGYQSDPVVVQGAANLVGLFQFDQLASSSHVKLLESIVGHLISVFKVQTEDGALVAIAKALNHFCNADHPIQRFAEFRVSRVYAIMSQRCDELVSLELVRSNTFRANLEMANNDALALVDQAEQAAVAKDTEYALSLALARLSTMERCIPLCSFKTMEETPDDHLSTIDLISLLQRRARDTKRLSGFVEAEEDTENSRYIRVCNLWQPSVYQHALEVAFARVLTQYQTILKQSTEAENVDGLNEQISPALSLRDKLVTHLSDVCKRVPLRELGSDSIQVSELSDDTRQEIIAYESATDLALLKVYLDLRILATPRLREQDTAAGKLAWFPSRQVQSRFAKIFEHQISKHNTDRETLVLKLKEAGSNEMEVELAQMATEAAFKHTTVLPWARAGMFADLGGSDTLSTSVSLMKAVSRDTTEVGSKTIQDITKEWKDLNPKRCMELHLRTLLSCTIDAKKNETENEGEEWEKVFGLAETLAQSLGTSSAQNDMAAVVEDFIGEGISVALKPNGEHLLSLLHSLGYYVKHGGFLKKGARLRLLEKLDGLVRGLSEDVIVQINDARNSEEECDDDDLDIEALFEFEKLLAKGTGWKPQSRISVPGSRSAAVVEEEHNSENEAPEEIGGEAMSPSAVDTRSNSQNNAKTSISKTSAMDKARRARKSKLSLASDDENEEDENVTDNDSVPSTSSKRRKVEMERGEDPELTRMKSKAQKNVFESDSDDVSSSPNLRRRSRRTGTQRKSTGRSSVATTAESDATSNRSSDDQRSSDDHTSANGRKRTLRKSETSPSHSHKKQALSSENEDDEPGYATDATSISVIRPGRKSRRRR